MHIDSYRFGQIVIDGVTYTEDVIITPKGVEGGWWRAEGHAISLFDLAHVLKETPRMLILGTGANGACRVLPEVEAYCRSQKIELVAAPTPEAVAEYNALQQKDGVIVALHLTC